MDVLVGSIVALALIGFASYSLNKESGDPSVSWFPDEQYNNVLFPKAEKATSFSKITEATEESAELCDGTVVTTRKIRQWH